MLVAVANKMQTAILAPTEFLAEQHFLTLSNMLRDSQVKRRNSSPAETGRQRQRQARRQTRQRRHPHRNRHAGTASGKRSNSANLGLVVVDEQHRLGVRHAATTLSDKGVLPPLSGDDGDADPANAGPFLFRGF